MPDVNKKNIPSMEELQDRFDKLKGTPPSEEALQSRYEKLRTNAQGEKDQSAYFSWKYPSVDEKMQNIQETRKLLKEQSRLAVAQKNNAEVPHTPKRESETTASNEMIKLKAERDEKIKQTNAQTYKNLTRIYGKDPIKQHQQLKQTKNNLLATKNKIVQMRKEARRLPSKKAIETIKRLNRIETKIAKKLERINRKLSAGSGLIMAGRKAKENTVVQYRLLQQALITRQQQKHQKK